MSRIKGGRANSMDVAQFLKKGKGKPPAKKVPPRRPMGRPMSSMPMDSGAMDEGAGDTMPEQDTDVMPPSRGRFPR